MSSDPRQPEPEICHRCGTPLPAGGPPGFCMVCFAEDLRDDETERALKETEYCGSLEAAGFTLGEVIGSGGMGIVYRARQRSPERDVAVKMLRPHLAKTEEHRRRFLVEAEAMAGLHHPGILPLYAAGDADGQPWLAMKLVTGKSLAEKLSAYTGNWRGIAALMAELADALQHAHSRGVIHRDLKPANILFDEDAGRPVLTDFGLAKWPARTEEFTLQAAVMGTLAYMAPDVAEHGTRAATTATDVYGLGAVMYELLTGRPPFTGELSMASLERLITENPPVPRSLVPAIPLEVEIICLKALARSPENRYRSAELMAADLRAWLRGDPIAARPVSVTGRMVRLARRYPRTALLAVVFVLTLLVSAALLGLQNMKLERSLARARAARTDAENLVTYTTQELPARLAPAGRLDALDGVFERVATYYSTATAREAGGEDAPAALLRHSAFLTEWTHTLHAGGRRADALARAEEACQSAARAIEAGAVENSAAVMAAAHRRRGELLTAAGRHAEAFVALDEAAAAVRKGLSLEPGNNLLTFELADVLSNFAYTHVAAQNAAAALPYARQARQLCITLAAQSLPDLSPVQLRRVQERAVLCHYDLARTAEALGDFPLRLESDEAYLAAAESLAAAAPGDATWQQALIPACNRLAETLRAAPPPLDSARIRELDARALQTARALVLRDPANQLWQTHHIRLVAHASVQALNEKNYPESAQIGRAHV